MNEEVFQRRSERERAWLMRFYSGSIKQCPGGKNALYLQRILAERLERVPQFDSASTHRIVGLNRPKGNPIAKLLFGFEFNFRVGRDADVVALQAVEQLYGAMVAAPAMALVASPESKKFWQDSIDQMLNEFIGEFKVRERLEG